MKIALQTVWQKIDLHHFFPLRNVVIEFLMIEWIVSRHYVTSPHFANSKLPILPYANELSYQNLTKDRTELLHVNQNHQSEPQLQQLQIQVQLQQQSATSPQHHQHHHQNLLSPSLSYSTSGNESLPRFMTNDSPLSCCNQSMAFSALEVDSGSSVTGSLPSPDATSCSLDAASASTSPTCALMDPSPSPNNVNATATGVGEPPLSQRVNVLQQRVILPEC